MRKYIILMAAVFILPAFYSCGKSGGKQAVKSNSNVDYSVLVDVPAGSYLQSDGMAGFMHEVEAFKIGKYEVTYELWHKVHGWARANGYAFSGAGAEGHDGGTGSEPTSAKNEPVTLVSWRDAVVWCNAYSRMKGLRPVYYSDPAFTYELTDSRDPAFEIKVNRSAGSCDNPFADWSAGGYRLPTEGEWQYAAGYIGPQNFSHYKYPAGSAADYDDPYLTDEVAWFYANSEYGTRDAGVKKPNKLGIYDMSGNVFEWCWDWYAKYPAEAKTGYRGPERGLSRIRRGGAYNVYASYLSIGSRFSYYPYHGDKTTGLRVARNSQKAK